MISDVIIKKAVHAQLLWDLARNEKNKIADYTMALIPLIFLPSAKKFSEGKFNLRNQRNYIISDFSFFLSREITLLKRGCPFGTASLC